MSEVNITQDRLGKFGGAPHAPVIHDSAATIRLSRRSVADAAAYFAVNVITEETDFRALKSQHTVSISKTYLMKVIYE